ncbi:peptidase inhibitor family I36 protein [Streptomyces sp. NPDC059247]|uniref:peptidase inhibitor family I36 protein n=1 Tax=Streptomyces sp. NPDC059247 TaxID=3346790 RepID=UPI0036898195
MTKRFARAARAIRLVGVALVTVAGTGMLAAPSANAAEQCWGEDVCVWDQNDGQGQIYRFSTPADGACLALDDVTWPDGTKSGPKTIHNAGSGGLAGFDSADCSGTSLGTLGPNNYANMSHARSFRVFDCESGKICFWENDNYSGTKKSVDYADSCSPIGITGKSAWNRSGKAIGLYDGTFCVGSAWKGDVASGAFATTSGASRISRV